MAVYTLIVHSVLLLYAWAVNILYAPSSSSKRQAATRGSVVHLAAAAAAAPEDSRGD